MASSASTVVKNVKIYEDVGIPYNSVAYTYKVSKVCTHPCQENT